MIKSLQFVIICFSFAKLLFFLRIFDDLSYLIQMLFSVFRDLRPFLLFFGIVIIFFSMILAVLLKDDLNNYEALGPVVYFIIAMRESIGDFDTDDSIINNSDYKVLIWLFYFMILIIGNVVFMNFIIAVVN